MAEIRVFLGSLLNLAPIIAFFIGYHKYLMDKLDEKIDATTYFREIDISNEYQKKSGDNILRILNRIENRIERIEQKLMK